MSGNAPSMQKVESLIRVTSRLIGVLDHEVEMLRAMRVTEIEQMQDEKMALTIAYEECVRSLADDTAVLEAMEPAMRQELGALAARFDDALAENARALNAVRDSHDRLLKAIVDAVADKRARHKGYGASATFERRPRGRTAPPLSLTYDYQL
jgi:hypothetical protein